MRADHPPIFEGAASTVRIATPFYSLLDVGTGNRLGTYDDFEEVAGIVVALLGANGAEYADDLDLSREDVEGNWERVATGTDLLRMVGFGRAQEAR